MSEAAVDPTEEEVAAALAAIEVVWPRPSRPVVDSEPPSWRFAGRWWTKPIPLRRDRPW